MTFLARCLSVVTLALGCGLNLLLPAEVTAAPLCVSRDEVGMAGAAGWQFPGGTGGTGASTGGVGGTGVRDENGGVGGTGAPILRPGGTGGTGIVGTITGFASICVNGLEVHIGQDVAVSANGAPASSAQLAIGQVVAVEAFATRRGLQAGRIAILNVYEGPLTALPDASTSLRVMGQAVRLAPGARVAEGLRAGEPVRVSGLRDAKGQVVASRIERAPGLKQASAIGAVDASGSLQGLKLGSRVAPAREVLVRGQWTGRQLEVAQTRPDPSLPFAGRVHNVVIEGLVQRSQARQLMVAGIKVTLGQGTVIVGKPPAAWALDQRVRVSGVFSGKHELQATRIELPDERADNPRREGSRRGDEHGASDSAGSANSGHGGRDATDVRTERQDDHGVDDSSGGDRTERVDRSGKSEPVDTVQRPERSGSGNAERVEKLELEKVDKVEQVEKAGKPEKIERVEKVETPEKVDKVEQAERPEMPETLEKSGKVERPERSGH